MTEPLRILVFGQSNTGGVQLAEGEAAWPSLVAAALPAMLGRPVDVAVRPFFAHAPGSGAYLERELEKRRPDLVFVMITTFAFANAVIEPGVRKRFGERAGNAYQSLATKFDGATRNRGALLAKVNETARAAATRLLPAEPVASYEVALDGTVAALRLLARREDLQVVAMHGFVKLPKPHRGRRSRKQLIVERFLSAVTDECRSLRVPFINLYQPTLPDGWYLPDGLHVSAEAHRAIAAAALAAFQDGRVRV